MNKPFGWVLLIIGFLASAVCYSATADFDSELMIKSSLNDGPSFEHSLLLGSDSFDKALSLYLEATESTQALNAGGAVNYKIGKTQKSFVKLSKRSDCGFTLSWC